MVAGKQVIRLMCMGILLLGSLFVQNVDAQINPRIINGGDANHQNYPWMVALIWKEAGSASDGHFCGGALISSRYVLTAAHCVTQDSGATIDPRSFLVQIGGAPLSTNSVSGVEVLGIASHPAYDSDTIVSDIALLKLKTAVADSPVRVPRVDEYSAYQAGLTATVLGWGRLHPVDREYPTMLQEAMIPVAADTTCSSEIGEMFNPDVMMCAGTKSSASGAYDGVDSCYGDSGGPLVIRDASGAFVHVGVVSWGYGCASHESRGVYAKTIAARDFILSEPMAKPVSETTPRAYVVSDGPSGVVVECEEGTYWGDPVTSLSYVWLQGEKVVGESKQYKIKSGDSYLRCAVLASNTGGESIAVTPNYYVGNLSGDENKDTTKPTARLKAFVCNSTTCTFDVLASDNKSSVSRVQAVAEIRYTKRRGSSGRQTVTVKRTIKAAKRKGGLWRGSFPLVRRTRQTVRVIVSVKDGAGNVNAKAIIVGTKTVQAR